MNKSFHFADLLEQVVARSAYTPGQLAHLSGLPKSTIVNWLNGRVRKPRDWQPLVKLLTVLRLGETEASTLLEASGHPPLAELRLLANDESDQDLLRRWPATVTSASYAHPPFQAIADIPYFVGREKIIRRITKKLLAPDDAPICVLQGMAGTGKTTMAARLAYDLRTHFPDGVLWARLDTSDTMAIAATFAEAYGGSISQYDDLASRSRMMRGLLAEKRALIILDNAISSAGVEPLLPPTGRCAVLITTRHQNLRVAQGAHHFSLGAFPLDAPDSHRLFAHFLGAKRAAAEAGALAQIAATIGHLPLALVIVASRLAFEPGWSTASFLARLRERIGRLQALHYDDQSVQLSFNLSYERLEEAERPFFAALSVFAGDDFSPEAAAAVADISLTETQDQLRKLHSLSLVQAGQAGRYRLHPLLRDFGRSLLVDETAVARLIAYFSHFVQNNRQDYKELARENDNICAALETAWERGDTAVFAQLIYDFVPYLVASGQFERAEQQLHRAMDSAQSQGDEPGFLRSLMRLAQVARQRHDYDKAQSYLQTAWPLVEKRGDHLGTWYVESGIIASCRRDFAAAQDHLRQGLALGRQNHEPETLVLLLKELGVIEVTYGRYQQAETYYLEALTLARRESLWSQQPALLRCLGGIFIARDGDYTAAKEPYEEGLRLARHINHSEGIIYMLNNLGVVAFQEGDGDGAQSYLQESLALARRSGNQNVWPMLLANLGKLAFHAQELAQAESLFREGLAVAIQIKRQEMVVSLQGCLGVLAGANTTPLKRPMIIYD